MCGVLLISLILWSRTRITFQISQIFQMATEQTHICIYIFIFFKFHVQCTRRARQRLLIAPRGTARRYHADLSTVRQGRCVMIERRIFRANLQQKSVIEFLVKFQPVQSQSETILKI